jgi:hypothetical protein
MVGLIPLLAVSVLDDRVIDKLPGFKKRMNWFLTNLPELGRHVTRTRDAGKDEPGKAGKYLMAVVPLHRLTRVLSYMLDEDEFLSPYGLRSLSRYHLEQPFQQFGPEYLVRYDPADSTTGLFGGNSNWRGPIWFPLSVVLLQALERYYHFYGDGLIVPCPSKSGQAANLHEVAKEIAVRLVKLFRADGTGRRPCHGDDKKYIEDPNFRNLLLFHEYFDGDNGRGIGASHQTGWTGLVANLIEQLATDQSLMGVEGTARMESPNPLPPEKQAESLRMRASIRAVSKVKPSAELRAEHTAVKARDIKGGKVVSAAKPAKSAAPAAKASAPATRKESKGKPVTKRK